MKQTTIPKRSDVIFSDQWDLCSLFANDDEWESALKQFSNTANDLQGYKEKISNASTQTLSRDDFSSCLKVYAESNRLAERVGQYAFLKKSTDESDADNLDKTGRFMMAVSAYEAELSWLVPSIQAIPEGTLASLMYTIDGEVQPGMKEYIVWLEKLAHNKPYILSEKEERILALQIESTQAPKNAFSQLTNVDINYGSIITPEGEKPLSQTTFSSFLENPARAIRKEAYTKFYNAFDNHKNTIATLYTGSVQQDVAFARIRGYTSARHAALYPDNVPESVYDNLISTIKANLSPLHRYYALRKKVLQLQDLRHYDVYVPLVSSVTLTTPYTDAVELISQALSPLGDDYTKTMKEGLLGGWVDKYENKGKRSGAFSSGGFDGYPYILMNYKETVLRDVFTLAHEAGHSMHSWYSAKHNPFLSYNYTIFEAEVASTFNEDLLFRHLLATTSDKNVKTYLLANRASDIAATLYRQTMFAEYEQITHSLVESGTPLSATVLREMYGQLLREYFGPLMNFEAESNLEALRIPHFYNAFYVYKYATGISASLALAQRVTSGGTKERDDYFKFLHSGGSRYPIDSLKLAGVNMETSEPIQEAINTFSKIIDELELLLG